MIQPTRTNLLMLRDRLGTVASCATILKGRRQVLIKEFLEVSKPLLQSREEIRRLFGRAIKELQISIGLEGRPGISSVAAVGRREFGVRIVEQNILGLHYKDLEIQETAVRALDERGYDYLASTPHLEEAAHLFETMVEEMLEIARFEGKFRRLAEELLRITRRIKVLEERVMPGLRSEIKMIAQHLAEREREAFYRLKMFKAKQGNCNFGF